MKTIILGDSFNNTLGLIRSLGKAGSEVTLILVGEDRLFVSKSRFVKNTIFVDSIQDCELVLKRTLSDKQKVFLICSNDTAAEWVDQCETWLSDIYLTPMRGKRIGKLFDKPEQCALAEKFGITTPKSFVYQRSESFPGNLIYPILIKPANSNYGKKSDIHICRSPYELNEALSCESNCKTFIVQEYIEKDFEINLIGISTESKVVIPGGIKKLRHYPTPYSPCSFGKFLPIEKLQIDPEPIKEMINAIGYHGPFSVEFLKKGKKNFFMEINFRHDGLAFAATASGVNLLKMYIDQHPLDYKVKPTYLMDLSTDYCHVKDGNITKYHWLKDFIKTGCQLNFNISDPMPTVYYYLSKLHIMRKRILNRTK